MREYDIYLGYDGIEATAHGAYFVQDGFNAADAVTRFIADEAYYRAIAAAESEHGPVREVAAIEDDWEDNPRISSASAFASDDGTWELHVYDVDGNDDEISLPAMHFMSASDAAAELDVSRMRVNQLVHDGKLSARNVGGSWLVSADSVRARRRGMG